MPTIIIAGYKFRFYSTADLLPSGMITLVNNVSEQVKASGIRFVDHILYVSLDDGREVSVPIDQVEWLAWLAGQSHAGAKGQLVD
jgi:hypothetical protein